jgi:hypothetical protein
VDACALGLPEGIDRAIALQPRLLVHGEGHLAVDNCLRQFTVHVERGHFDLVLQVQGLHRFVDGEGERRPQADDGVGFGRRLQLGGDSRGNLSHVRALNEEVLRRGNLGLDACTAGVEGNVSLLHDDADGAFYAHRRQLLADGRTRQVLV